MRSRVIEQVAQQFDTIVCTTGFASRELDGIPRRRQCARFLTVGSMGHASSIALGVALARPDSNTVCIDGDGAALMHMGAMATAGAQRLSSFKHVLIDNGVHDSVGGQPVCGTVDFSELARVCGYRVALEIDADEDSLAGAVSFLKEVSGPAMLVVKCAAGAQDGLGRPTGTPLHNKREFIDALP